MSDITAVVIHQHEPSLERALRSIRDQTLQPAEILMADPDLSPVDRAVNEVASRVRTPFLVQVDADMVLDRDCFARLREAVADPPGVVQGHLRDPLVGRVWGIHLFPVDGFQGGGWSSSISPDADFLRRMRESGRPQMAILSFVGAEPVRHTLGEHLPPYTNAYAFGRYYVQGTRFLYRGHPTGAWDYSRRLQVADHPAATSALIGLSVGIFDGRIDGMRLRYLENDAFKRLRVVLERQGQGSKLDSSRPLPTTPEASFASYLTRGRGLRSGSRLDLEEELRYLAPADTLPRWFALLGLSRGLLEPSDGPEVARTEAEFLIAALESEDPSLPRSGCWKGLERELLGQPSAIDGAAR